MISHDNTRVAFIGVGVMGSPMAQHILEDGYELVVYSRTKERAESLIDAGARWADSVGEAVRDAQVVITMVGTPDDVEDIYISEGGIIESAPAGAFLIDMSTSSPKLAREIYAISAVNDLHALDCPVTGGDIGAKEATLSIFVGGQKDDLAEVLPILDCMGEKVTYQGTAGMGQLAKLANQVALAGSMLGTVEAIAFAKQTGLNVDSLLEAMEGGTAESWTLLNMAPRIVQKDFTPGFFVRHFMKDMGIALAVADEMELTLPGLETAYQLYDLLSIVGGENLGSQALELIYEDEKACSGYGLDWSLAEYDDDDDDDDDCDDDECDCGHNHKHNHGRIQGPQAYRRNDDGPMLGMDSFFSKN